MIKPRLNCPITYYRSKGWSILGNHNENVLWPVFKIGWGRVNGHWIFKKWKVKINDVDKVGVMSKKPTTNLTSFNEV